MTQVDAARELQNRHTNRIERNERQFIEENKMRNDGRRSMFDGRWSSMSNFFVLFSHKSSRTLCATIPFCLKHSLRFARGSRLIEGFFFFQFESSLRSQSLTFVFLFYQLKVCLHNLNTFTKRKKHMITNWLHTSRSTARSKGNFTSVNMELRQRTMRLNDFGSDFILSQRKKNCFEAIKSIGWSKGRLSDNVELFWFSKLKKNKSDGVS